MFLPLITAIFLASICAQAATDSANHILPGAPAVNTSVQLLGMQERLTYVGRYQSFDPRAAADFDEDIKSPKSVNFSPDGKYAIVNSLEGMKTVFYDAVTRRKVKTIFHHFTAANAELFGGEESVFHYEYLGAAASVAQKNVFDGKPVEAAFSHGGRYLWVPYYRRSYDIDGISPSAIAIIEMKPLEQGGPVIVRVMPAGAIPKFIAISPDNRYAAIIHWGDNTAGLIDISASNASGFRYVRQLTIEGGRVNLRNFVGVNRDEQCGACLRGAFFSGDSKTLLVARMGTGSRSSGGIAGFDVSSGRYYGTIEGLPINPRHMVRNRDSSLIYVSSNHGGQVAKAPLSEILEMFFEMGRQADIRHVQESSSLNPNPKPSAAARASHSEDQIFQNYKGWQLGQTGRGARTIELDPTEQFLFVAVNDTADLVILDAQTLATLARIDTDPFTVGLGTSPRWRSVRYADGSLGEGLDIWTTSQGRAGQGGGDAVNRYWLKR